MMKESTIILITLFLVIGLFLTIYILTKYKMQKDNIGDLILETYNSSDKSVLKVTTTGKFAQVGWSFYKQDNDSVKLNNKSVLHFESVRKKLKIIIKINDIKILGIEDKNILVVI